MAPASRVIDQVQQALGNIVMTDHAMLHRQIVSAAIEGIRGDLRRMTKGIDPADAEVTATILFQILMPCIQWAESQASDTYIALPLAARATVWISLLDWVVQGTQLKAVAKPLIEHAPRLERLLGGLQELEVASRVRPATRSGQSGRGSYKARASGGHTVTSEAHDDELLTFGKHTGRSFSEVLETEPGYCTWAVQQDNPSPALAHFASYVRRAQQQSQPQASSRSSQLPGPADPVMAEPALMLPPQNNEDMHIEEAAQELVVEEATENSDSEGEGPPAVQKKHHQAMAGPPPTPQNRADDAEQREEHLRQTAFAYGSILWFEHPLTHLALTTLVMCTLTFTTMSTRTGLVTMIWGALIFRLLSRTRAWVGWALAGSVLLLFVTMSDNVPRQSLGPPLDNLLRGSGVPPTGFSQPVLIGAQLTAVNIGGDLNVPGDLIGETEQL